MLYQLSYTHHKRILILAKAKINCQRVFFPGAKQMARQEGFEPSTDGLEGRCSVQLSYWR